MRFRIKILLLLSLFLFIIINSVGCVKDYDVEYFDKNLSAEGFILSEYKKTILYSNVTLLEENRTTILLGNEYSVVKKVKQLTQDITNMYSEEETTYTTTIEGNPVTLSITDESFSEVIITEFSLSGKLKDDATDEVLKVENAINATIEINLNDGYKVKNIKINYTDSTTNYNVVIEIAYSY